MSEEYYIDEEYGEDDYGLNDYGAGEDEEKYEDEYQEDYKQDEQQIATFGFKDLLRIGAQDDEFLELPLGTDIEQIKIDPDLKFKLEVRNLLQTNKFQFSERDKGTIKKAVKLLPFIQYKNAFLFIIGYFCFIKVLNEIDHRIRNQQIDLLKRVVESEKNYAFPDVIRYARYWKYVLMSKLQN